MTNPKTIAVLGAGSMGCLYGALLSTHARVVIVDSWDEHVRAIRDQGLTLIGPAGISRKVLEARTYTDSSDLDGSADIAICLVNANSTATAASAASRLLTPDGFLLTLQNGIGNIEACEAAVGKGRVLAGLSYHSAALRELGTVEHTHQGPTWIGELDGSGSKRVEELSSLLAQAGAAPEPVDNIVSWVWTKFILNCGINAVCAAAGIRVGEIPLTPGAHELQTKIIEECLAIVSAKGIALADPKPLESIRAHSKKKFNKPSMLQHMEANRETEIEALNGAVVRLGKELGIETPYNQALTWMIRSIQHHRIFAATHPAFDYAALEKATSLAGKGHSE